MRDDRIESGRETLIVLHMTIEGQNFSVNHAQLLYHDGTAA
jgi:hypothetical protein